MSGTWAVIGGEIGGVGIGLAAIYAHYRVQLRRIRRQYRAGR